MSRREFVKCVGHDVGHVGHDVGMGHPFYRKTWCGKFESEVGFVFLNANTALHERLAGRGLVVCHECANAIRAELALIEDWA